MVETDADKKQGIGINHKGQWAIIHWCLTKSDRSALTGRQEPATKTLIEVNSDHRLADEVPLGKMVVSSESVLER